MIDLWRELLRSNRVLAWFGLAHLVLFVVLVGIAAFDAHQIQGINRWFKPMKFAISIAIYAWTIGWLLAYLKPDRARAVRVISWIVVITMFVEIFLIVLQPARGTFSHFNLATPLDARIFFTMGVAIIINSLAAIYALALFFKATLQIPRSYLWGIRLGLLIFLLASAEGGFMAQHNSHYARVSANLQHSSPGLPFVNWSRSEGDLRIAHFIGLHALQVVPLVGFLLHHYSRRLRFVRPVAWTFAFSLLYGALAAGLFVQAMVNQPMLSQASTKQWSLPGEDHSGGVCCTKSARLDRSI